MKIAKTVLVPMLVLALILGVALASFTVGVRYGRMQADTIRSEFLNDRAGPSEGLQSDPRPTPRSGISANPVMPMIHDMLGIGQ